MIIKQINKKEPIYKDQYIALLDYCFRMWGRKGIEDEWEYLNKEEVEDIILASIEDTHLASAITLSKRSIYLDGNPFKMYGIGGVATDSLYRSGGVCTNLIKAGMKEMYEEEVPFSLLVPFSYPFYEKLGWSWCFDYMTYNFEIDRLKKFRGNGNIEKITKQNLAELNEYYKSHVSSYNGVTIRKLFDWEKKLNFGRERYGVLVKDDISQLTGYMIYEIDGGTETFKILEIEYTHMNALKTLLSYTFKHSAQAKMVFMQMASHHHLLDLLDDPKCDVKKTTYMMGRIIHLKKALEAYRYEKDGTFIIKVEDQLLEENTGKFKITIENRRATQVLSTEEQEDLEIDIRYLAKMIIGFRTLEVLKQLEQVTIYNEKVISYFKQVHSQVALYDYF